LDNVDDMGEEFFVHVADAASDAVMSQLMPLMLMLLSWIHMTMVKMLL
jgi:hypothetical protein